MYHVVTQRKKDDGNKLSFYIIDSHNLCVHCVLCVKLFKILVKLLKNLQFRKKIVDKFLISHESSFVFTFHYELFANCFFH
jgi:hypothetical protein